MRARPSCLALLGMELAAGHVVARNERGDGTTVIGARHHIVRVRGCQMIRVHEIGMLAGKPGDAADSACERASSMFQPICGILSDWSSGAIGTTSPSIQPKPWVVDMLEPALGHQLHADADAEERLAAARHVIVDCIPQAGDRLASHRGSRGTRRHPEARCAPPRARDRDRR